MISHKFKFIYTKNTHQTLSILDMDLGSKNKNLNIYT